MRTEVTALYLLAGRLQLYANPDIDSAAIERSPLIGNRIAAGTCARTNERIVPRLTHVSDIDRVHGGILADWNDDKFPALGRLRYGVQTQQRLRAQLPRQKQHERTHLG